MRKAASGRVSNQESVVESIRLVTNESRGVIVTNERTGRFAVYDYDLASQAIGAPIFEHPEVDISAPDFSADGTTVEGVHYEDDKPRVAWLTADRKKLQEDLDKTFRGKINRIVSESRDGKRVLIWTGGADDPGSYYLFDRPARRMTLFATPYEKLAEKSFSRVEPIRYQARDGLSIPGYLTLPAGRDPRGLPLIVMPHGGPFARDSYAFHPWVQLLASRGYAVLQPNFRGSTGYGRTYVERGYGQWGTGMQDDLDDGVAWLVGKGIADPKRVCLMGASYGGYAALWGAIRNPDRYRCAISFAGVTDIRGMLKYDARFLMAPRYSRQWRKKVEGEEKRDLAAISPLQQAGRLDVPVLIAHGEVDANVPAEQSRKLVTSLRARGANVQPAFYPHSGHDFERAADSLDFMRRVEAFLELHNPANAAPPGAQDAQPVSTAIEAGELAPGPLKKAKLASVMLRYRVSAAGRVEGCSLAETSGVAALDKQLCAIAEERFQYRPARDAAGKPQPGTGSTSVALRTVAAPGAGK